MSPHYHILVYPAGKGGEAQTLLVTGDGAEAFRVLEAFHWCAPEAHATLSFADFDAPPSTWSRALARIQYGVWRVGEDVTFLTAADLQARRDAAKAEAA